MEHTIEIKKIINKGLGLGYLPDGMVVMTSYVLPDEVVRVKEIKRTKKYLVAENIEILEKSPHRIKPPCPYYHQCGGCNIQHLDYNYQLQIKQALLQETFERNKIPFAVSEILPTMPSPKPFNYRHKIRLHISSQGEFGFHAAKSNIIVPVKKCLLATDKINASLEQLSAHPQPRLHLEHFKALEIIHCPKSGYITMVPVPKQKNSSPPIPSLFSSIADTVDLKVRQPFTRDDNVSPSSRLSQSFSHENRSYELQWDSHCFFQVNAHQNGQLVALAEKEFQADSSTLLDLYCGVGNFSVPAAYAGYRVTGVEHNQHSIHWARKNCGTGQLRHKPVFMATPVTDAVDRFVKEQRQFHTIILDPPRQGLDKNTAHRIPQLGAKKIMYISCDPATLTRDLRTLSSQGYAIKKAVPVDMFPQTHHIESFVVLEKN